MRWNSVAVDLPELAERDATGDKAAIYAEIRRLGGVPRVALIFRHLATLPGGLEWAWEAIGPAWRQGALQEAAWRLAREAPLEPIAPIPREALAALGVDAAGEEEIRVVLTAYNRANPENLLSVSCLLRMLEGAVAAAFASRPWTPPPAPGPLPPMIDVAAMPPPVANLLALVAAPDVTGGPRVIPSLYRHFGHRPAFLALAVALLLPRQRDGSVDRAAAAIRAAMDGAADELVRSLSAPAAPDSRIRPVLARFGADVIPRMIVAGSLLEGALPAA